MNKTTQSAPAQFFELQDLAFDEKDFLVFLRNPNERSLIPSIQDKMELKIWSEDGMIPNEQYRTLYEFLGKPAFKPVDNISNAQLPAALESLLGVMNKKAVFVKTFTNIPDRELYRFVTKELFPTLTTGNMWPLPVALIYEEFHSNEVYRIKKAASDVLRALFGKEAWKYQWKLWKKVLDNYAALKQFAMSYEGFDIRSIEMDEMSSNGNEALVLFEAEFYAICHDMVFVHHFEGDGSIDLFNKNGSWCARHVTLPERV